MDFLKFLGKAVAFIMYFIMSFFIMISALAMQESALQNYRYSNVYVWQPADLPPDDKKVLIVKHDNFIGFNENLKISLYKEDNIIKVMQSKAPITPLLEQNVPLETIDIPFSKNMSLNFILQDIKLLSTKDSEGKTIYYFLQGRVFNTDFDFGQNDKVIKTGISPTDTKQKDKIYLFTLIAMSILLAIVASSLGLKAIKQRKAWGYLIVSCMIMVTISFLIVGFGAIKIMWAIL